MVLDARRHEQQFQTGSGFVMPNYDPGFHPQLGNTGSNWQPNADAGHQQEHGLPYNQYTEYSGTTYRPPSGPNQEPYFQTGAQGFTYDPPLRNPYQDPVEPDPELPQMFRNQPPPPRQNAYGRT